MPETFPNHWSARPLVGIIGGTGVELLSPDFEIEFQCKFSEIYGFPEPTAPSHKGEFYFGNYKGISLIIFQGRLHYYEGFSAEEITYPIKLAKALGVETLLLTNAAGAVRSDWKEGDIIALKDHIFLQPFNPLRGPNDENFGPRFPDMSEAYSPVEVAEGV